MKKSAVLIVSLYVTTQLIACTMIPVQIPPNPAAQPTSTETLSRQAVSTRPTPTDSSTPTPSPTRAANPVLTQPVRTPPARVITELADESPAESAPCDRAAPGRPIDITIPDNSIFHPGQPFTKTWRLQNIGTCTWNPEYVFVWFSGERFDALGINPLAHPVAPGQNVDISIDMRAPDTAGVHQSNWKISSPSGQLFGLGPNGDAPIWVRIVVVEPDTPAPVLSLTPASTPVVYISGQAGLGVDESLDVDMNLTSTGENADLLFSLNGNGLHQLAPQNGSLIGGFGPGQPTLPDCQPASLQGGVVNLDTVAVGDYACIRTNLGLPGWIHLVDLNLLDHRLTLEILVWSTP